MFVATEASGLAPLVLPGLQGKQNRIPNQRRHATPAQKIQSGALKALGMSFPYQFPLELAIVAWYILKICRLLSVICNSASDIMKRLHTMGPAKKERVCSQAIARNHSRGSTRPLPPAPVSVLRVQDSGFGV